MKPLSHLLFIFAALFYLPVHAQESAKVFVVHSYEEHHICGAPQAQGVVDALAEAGWQLGKNLDVESHYMDTKRTHTTKEAIKKQAQIALDRIETFKPQVVVVLDDNAIREVMLPLAGRNDLSVVFSGMNGQPMDYSKRSEKGFINTLARPGSNITGVYEKLHVSKSIQVVKAALTDFGPNDKVVGITDYTPTGNAITRQFELELTDVGDVWAQHRVKDFEEYKALIHKLNKDPSVRAIYPAALSLKTASGETYTAPKIFEWTTQNSVKPEMALNYFFAKIGLFGGAAVDFTKMGKMVGLKTANILNGIPAGNQAIEDASDYAIVFNVSRAAKLGIKVPDSLLTAADHVYK